MTPRSKYAAFVVAVFASAACANGNDYPPRRGYESTGPTTDYPVPWPTPDTTPPKERPPDEPFGPKFGATITQADPPPALGAATLVVAADGRTVIASDPDRDRVLLVDVPTRAVRTVSLDKASEPGRIVDDGSGRAHVVLRGAGSIATIDLATATLTEKRSVCAAPRGITAVSSTLYVACAGGELVALPAATGDATLVARIDADLRDIVGFEDRLVVSRFRSAEVLTLDFSGKLLARQAPPSMKPGTVSEREPFVAWRMARRGDGVQVVHQAATKEVLAFTNSYTSGSGGGCSAPVITTSTVFTSSTVSGGPVFSDAVVPVDFALTKDGTRYVVIAAGNNHFPGIRQIHYSPVHNGCTTQWLEDPKGQLVAAAFLPNDALVVLSREPAVLHIRDRQEPEPWSTIDLGGESREDTGHAIFHANSTQGGIACASCHPEGGDDGRTWKLTELVNGMSTTIDRRTPTLRATLQDTAPFHWKGDLASLAALAKASWSDRMDGPDLSGAQIMALEHWTLKIPAVPTAPADTEAALRGKTVFESAQCATCHSGARFTNNKNADVGAKEAFQVPSLLGLKLRAPYMHNGCAKTTLDVFGTACKASQHGQTSSLTAAQMSDLAAYLESL